MRILAIFASITLMFSLVTCHVIFDQPKENDEDSTTVDPMEIQGDEKIMDTPFMQIWPIFDRFRQNYTLHSSEKTLAIKCQMQGFVTQAL